VAAAPPPLDAGLSAVLDRQVGDADTAAALGSGDLPVLGTPRLLAWCEAATVAAVDDHLPAGATTVGSRIQLEHLRASRIGAILRLTATLVHAEGRLLRFEVAAVERRDHEEHVVGHAEVTRVVVDRRRFLAR
jgi:predicted thioesterase